VEFDDKYFRNVVVRIRYFGCVLVAINVVKLVIQKRIGKSMKAHNLKIVTPFRTITIRVTTIHNIEIFPSDS